MELNASVKALAILSAIPVASYAVWADYFTRGLAERERIKDPIDAPTEQLKARLAALCALFFQFGVYVGTQELRADAPFMAQVLFAAAILAQVALQGRVALAAEPKPKPRLSAAPPPAPIAAPATDSGQVALRAFVWATLGGVLYLMIMVSSVLLFALPGKFLGLPNWANTLCVLAGGAFGVGAGLLANFALGAYHLKKILPVTPIADEPLRSTLEECFARHGLRAPEFWRVDGREAMAMIAGFNGGRGILAQGLFVSRGALEALNDGELRAVVLHEVSHLRLRHLKKRLLWSAALIVGLTVAATFSVLLSLLYMPEGPGRTLVSYAAAAAAMTLSFRYLAAQSRRHELEADRHAVRELGADPDAMASALQKFDRLNHAEGAPRPLRSHPSTEERLLALEWLRAEARARAATEAAASDSKDEDNRRAA
jgi:Zn-dependent protease with chaperone function